MVKWNKMYDLTLKDENFRVFLSEDDKGNFHTACLWYYIEGERLLKIPGTAGSLNFALETRVDTTAEAAWGAIIDWIKAKFGEDYKLVESK